MTPEQIPLVPEQIPIFALTSLEFCNIILSCQSCHMPLDSVKALPHISHFSFHISSHFLQTSTMVSHQLEHELFVLDNCIPIMLKLLNTFFILFKALLNLYNLLFLHLTNPPI